MEHDDLTDTTMTGAEVQDMVGFSDGHKFYQALMPVPVFDAQIKVDGGGRVFSLNAVGDFVFFLPVPLALGSLTLHIDQIIVGVRDADAGDYVDRVLLRYTEQDGDLTTALDDGTNRTAKGAYTYGDGGAGVVDPEDTTGHALVMVYLIGSITTPSDLDIGVVSARCWYE